MNRVVFVCTGNMCRSPMAEAILRQKWSALGRNDLFVSSSGIHAHANQPAASTAIEVCQEHGIDLTHHISRPINPREMESADLVFTMELVQKNFITLFFPQLSDRVFQLANWPEKDSKRGNVPDPVRGTIKDYRKVFDIIDHHIDRIMPFLQEWFPGRK